MLEFCHGKDILKLQPNEIAAFSYCLSICLSIPLKDVSDLINEKLKQFTLFYQDAEIIEHIILAGGNILDSENGSCALTYIPDIDTAKYEEKVDKLCSLLSGNSGKRRWVPALLRKKEANVSLCMPSQLIFDNKALVLYIPSEIGSRKNLEKSWKTGASPSELARRYAKWRNLGFTKSDLSVEQAAFIHQTLPLPRADWNQDLNMLMLASTRGLRLPIAPENAPAHLLDLNDEGFNVLESFEGTRNFVYCYCFNSGHFPDDDEVDLFVRKWNHYLHIMKLS